MEQQSSSTPSTLQPLAQPTTRPTEGMQYLNLAQLSAKLGGRSRTSVYRDVDAGRLPPPIKLGSRLYWRESEIDCLMSSLGVAA